MTRTPCPAVDGCIPTAWVLLTSAAYADFFGATVPPPATTTEAR
ncbi:MAG TPA: hypothetical protein PKA98_11745 [Acidimicrobiales bacterium]|mgnify:CR=1 FL=1|nr:hypothetical protein [Acidimicrobiales bacterium]